MRLPFSGARVDSTFYYRDYSRVDAEQLVLNLESIDWSTVYMTSSVDEQVTFFNHAVLNQSILLGRGVRRPYVNPWFDIYIERAIIDRTLAHRAWRSHGTAESWELYKRFRNRVHCLVRQAKRSYMGRFLNPSLPPTIL
jgi:hypothetical protein